MKGKVMIKKIIISTDDIKDLITKALKKQSDFEDTSNNSASLVELYLPLINKYNPWINYANGVIYMASPIEDFEGVRNVTNLNNSLEYRQFNY